MTLNFQAKLTILSYCPSYFLLAVEMVNHAT